MSDGRGWQPPASGWQVPAGPPAVRPGGSSGPLPGAGGWTPPPPPGLIPLRPLTLGVILGAAFRVMRRNPRPTLGISLLLYGAVSIVSSAIVGGVVAWLISRIAMSSGEARDDIVAGGILGGGIALLVPIAGSVVVSAVLQGIISIEVTRATLGERLGTRRLLQRARGRIAPLIGWSAAITGALLVVVVVVVLISVLLGSTGDPVGAVLGSLVVLGAELGIVVIGLWLSTKLSFVPSALVVERLTLRAAIARSWTLTRGSFWRTLGIEYLVQLIVSTAAQVVVVPLGVILGIVLALVAPQGDPTTLAVVSVVGGVVIAAVSTVTSAITLIMQSAVATLLYLDLRMRREGLDIELQRFVEDRAAGRAGDRDPFAPPPAAPPGRPPAAPTDWPTGWPPAAP
ncbi:glycerophosphoryl diester phosphodiesterase membrane domain-containing protein [Galbitalea sp. SE-J8]|uniref:glycerophosphoryl diester phosphodiesterase membrane domain-containing protein n=1 Tax=Galbitalea sp. SE-J8 TaxID=3054952 RepID=UPI00259C8C96|nr:glycerophosphoryl diester phosphodiesterase membrane domain-containing protein [Galbitalea sp. SE-J8]MDM4762706.1 glycerophosphoryl diester phosphodiesterase membrane domain-containing protein [Galbitalea sp. SE-J8]